MSLHQQISGQIYKYHNYTFEGAKIEHWNKKTQNVFQISWKGQDKIHSRTIELRLYHAQQAIH